MGHSNWSDAAYQARQKHRSSTNQSAFAYDDQVRNTGVVQVHPLMNPRDVMRESRDSDQHPASLAIAVIFDVTGSMGNVPRVLQTKLGALMRVLIQKGYVASPQIMFGAVGDAYCDRVPLQVGQFESGLEMDDELGKIYLEGGGGGQVHETYELAMYFVAHHTAIDCYDKRGHKGYLFTIGDEHPYKVVSRQQVQEQIGDRLARDIPITQVIDEVQQRYEYFHIIPTNTSHGRNPAIQAHWNKLLGERVLLLDDESAVCETIALAIGLCEGAMDDLGSGAADLVQAGYSPSAANTAVSALSRYAAVHTPPARASIGLLPVSTGAEDDGRL